MARGSREGDLLRLSSPLCKEISLIMSGKSPLKARAIPHRKEGRFATVMNVGVGCDGRFGID